MSVSAGRGRHRPSVATRSHRGYAHRHRSLPALTPTEPPLARVLQHPARVQIAVLWPGKNLAYELASKISTIS